MESTALVMSLPRDAHVFELKREESCTTENQSWKSERWTNEPGFSITEAEAHTEEDAHQAQTHTHYDAYHRVDVQLCDSRRHGGEKHKGGFVKSSDWKQQTIKEVH